jgi:hypothetical protein
MLRDDVPSTSHGGPYYSELRPMVGLSPPMQLALGGRHACALSDDGEVSCWGLNNLGQLGLARASAETPTRVDGLSQIVAISTAYFTTCALDEAGAVFCWGEGTEGQLAVDPRELHGSMDKRTRAKAERVLGIGPAKEISVGGLSVCIREADDGVSCFQTKGHGVGGAPMDAGARRRAHRRGGDLPLDDHLGRLRLRPHEGRAGPLRGRQRRWAARRRG